MKPSEPSFIAVGESKSERYAHFLEQVALLITDERDEISVMANVSAALREAFGFFWVGFYVVRGGELRLGPFQGSVACYRIRHGRGVCGTAWARGCTLVVPDVDAFPGHIACSAASRSEIVVPLMAGAEVRAVLDIDSDRPAAFDDTDRHCLEQLARLMAAQLYGPQAGPDEA